MNRKNDIIFINHILESISDIEESVKKLSKEDFVKSKDPKDAAIRRIEVIGEAVKNISDTTKENYPKVEWKKIAGTRDRLIHAYFSIDLDITWEIIKIGLPELKIQMLKIKKELGKK